MENFTRLKRMMAERSDAAKLSWLIAALGVATLARWFLDQGRAGAPFAFYFPVILIGSVAFGWRWAIAAIVTSTIAASLFFIRPFMQVQVSDLTVALPFLISCFIIAYFGELLRSAISQADQRAEELDRFNRELHHRAKNFSAVVRMLLSKARSANDPAIALEALEGRLNALFSSSELLGYGTRPACQFGEIARVALAPFDEGQIRLNGSDCSVAESAAVPLAMALHELGTNAAKYGALSDPGGLVQLSWTRDAEGSISLSWIETGGPAVEMPRRSGMGSRLLRPYRGMREVSLVYDPNGVVCHLKVDGAAAVGPDMDSSNISSAA